MTIYQRLGNTVGQFLKGIDDGRRHPEEGEIHRPKMITAAADKARWSGGDLGMAEYATRRAMLNSWVYTAVMRKAMDVSAGQAGVFHNPSGVEGEGTQIPNHELMRILKKPNPVMGKQYLWQYTHQWLDLNGNSYWFLLPDETNRWLLEIWPLPAASVTPWPGNDPNDFIEYYSYTVDGREFRINSRNICHFRYPNPFDIYRGLSPLVAAMLPADADMAMAQWQGQFFGSDNVMPSAIINISSGDPKVPLDPSDVQALRDELTNNYSASRRKTAVVNAHSMSAQLLGWNARDMDFIQGRTFSKEEIYQIYGVFPGMMDKNATEANAEASRSAYNDLTMWPLFGLYSETIDSQILSRFYHKAQEFRFEDIRFGNRAQNLSESTGTADVLLIDERRKKFWGLEPLPNGEGAKLAGAQDAQPALPGGMPSQSLVTPDMSGTDQKSLSALHEDLRKALDFLEGD